MEMFTITQKPAVLDLKIQIFDDPTQLDPDSTQLFLIFCRLMVLGITLTL